MPTRSKSKKPAAPRPFGKNPALGAPYGMDKDDPANPYDISREAKKLQFWYAAQGAHPHYPLADWKYEVANNDTKLGYWEWVANQIENKAPVKIPITIPSRRR